MFVEKYPYTLPHNIFYDTNLSKAIHQSNYKLDTAKAILHIHIWPSRYDGSDFLALFPKEQIQMLQNRQAVLFIEYMGDAHQKQEHINTFRQTCERWDIDCDLLILAVTNENLTDPDMKFVTGLPMWFYVYWGFVNLHPQTFPNYQGEDVLNNIDWNVDREFPYEWFTSYRQQYNHKIQHGSKDFMLLQRSIRPHRDLTYEKLLAEGLWQQNNCSYIHRDIFLSGEKEQLYSILESGETYKGWDHRQYAKDSWVCLTSESCDYYDHPYMTEKWYQAVFNCLPMIHLGPQNSLELFRSFGFKTFDKFFEECYDKESSYEDRLNEVVKVLRYIGQIKDKLSWYKSMRDVLEYNYNHAINLGKFDSSNFMIDNFMKKFNEALRSIDNGV